MSLFVVEEAKCGRCGLCVFACPAGLVKLIDSESVPRPVDGAEEACFECGHCVAACPSGAFAHRSATPEQCLPIREEWRIGPQQVGQLMRGRRSVRNYETRPVTRETIAELLDIARFAPSGCNTQPVHWLVIHDTDQVRRISALVV
jgi:NAD-dependent dihydropyrimidine dehydrogenase PreA subunit